jgi:O-methyltransferase
MLHFVSKRQLRAQIASLQAERAALQAERAALSKRAGELEEHNNVVTEAATERAHQLQEKEAQLTDLHIKIATLMPEIDRLRGEHAALSKRVAELEEHNKALTEAATERAYQLQEKEAQLTDLHIKIATLMPEINRLRGEHAALSKRAAELEVQRHTDYQILQTHQQMMAGIKDTDPRFQELYEKCRPYTMTSVEALYALYKSVEYIVASNLAGDFAETGVWRGGSCMLIAETLLAFGDSSRRIFLFDTFEGHPRPDAEKDVDLWGNRAIDEWHRLVGEDNHGTWAYVSLDEVRENLARTGYPADKLVFVKGMVENTLGTVRAMDKLALLRLDTDWYASTKASLQHLYPRLGDGGVLIIDDYGHCKGSQQAADEYLAISDEQILLTRVDYTCRLAIKGTHRGGADHVRDDDRRTGCAP